MNNDLISRSALKEAMRKAKRGHYSAFSDITLQSIYQVIDNAPTVTPDKIQAIMSDYLIYRCEPERPQGEWIITREEQGAFGIIYKMRKCNRCGWENSLLIPRNFCPNCGAKMKGGAE